MNVQTFAQAVEEAQREEYAGNMHVEVCQKDYCSKVEQNLLDLFHLVQDR